MPPNDTQDNAAISKGPGNTALGFTAASGAFIITAAIFYATGQPATGFNLWLIGGAAGVLGAGIALVAIAVRASRTAIKGQDRA